MDMPAQIIEAKSLKEDCKKVMNLPGEHIIYARQRTFSTNIEEGYSEAEITIAANWLQARGLLVDYGTPMDSKTSKDYLWIKTNPYALRPLQRNYEDNC